jgi:hypothetical protein
MKKLLSLAAGVVLAGTATFAVAENATHASGYTIHHNAMTTDTLSPKVAKAYDIQRSKARGMLNVSVIKEKAGTTGQSVKAKVSAMASNLLTGHARLIDMREVTEGSATYYIGDFGVGHQETLNFELQVTPEGQSRPIAAKLSQQFFTD